MYKSQKQVKKLCECIKDTNTLIWISNYVRSLSRYTGKLDALFSWGFFFCLEVSFIISSCWRPFSTVSMHLVLFTSLLSLFLFLSNKSRKRVEGYLSYLSRTAKQFFRRAGWNLPQSYSRGTLSTQSPALSESKRLPAGTWKHFLVIFARWHRQLFMSI